MKTFLVLFFCLFFFDGNSQQPVIVTVEKREMSKGLNPAFIVNIPQADSKLTELHWRNYVNDRPLGIWLGGAAKQIGNLFRSANKKVVVSRLRIEKINDELFLKAIVIEDLSQQKLDIYAKIAEMDSSCQLIAFFQFTDSIFIGEQNVSPEIFLNLKNYVREFGVETYKEAVRIELRNAETELKDREKELRKLESERISFEKAINRIETGISDTESEQRILENDFGRQEDKIAELKRELRSYNKKSLEYESTKEEIKIKEKEKKQIVADINKQKNRISKFKAEIKSEQIRIDRITNQQETQLTRITEQELKISQIKDKIENIR